MDSAREHNLFRQWEFQCVEHLHCILNWYRRMHTCTVFALDLNIYICCSFSFMPHSTNKSAHIIAWSLVFSLCVYNRFCCQRNNHNYCSYELFSFFSLENEALYWISEYQSIILMFLYVLMTWFTCNLAKVAFSFFSLTKHFKSKFWRIMNVADSCVSDTNF